jgi:hypothetical protein
MIRFYLDEHQLLETDPNKLLSIILSSIKDINYWSTECIYDFVEGTYEQLKIYATSRREEISKDKNTPKSEKSRLTRFINNDTMIPKSRDKLIQFYYKQILLSEGKGLLPGFGMEGSLSNPEYQSIYTHTEKANEH